jgi:hypothetical protein
VRLKAGTNQFSLLDKEAAKRRRIYRDRVNAFGGSVD